MYLQVMHCCILLHEQLLRYNSQPQQTWEALALLRHKLPDALRQV
jgi:hypothetical protein